MSPWRRFCEVQHSGECGSACSTWVRNKGISPGTVMVARVCDASALSFHNELPVNLRHKRAHIVKC